MIYSNENRGIIQNRERARQIIDFSGIRYGNITPTDIDGFFEKANKAFVFYEYKLAGNDMPGGQRIALERLVNAIKDANHEAALFLCVHNHQNPQEDVNAAQATVERIFWNGKWWKGHGLTVKEQTDKFMSFVESVGDETEE